jgi:hypothetical protein
VEGWGGGKKRPLVFPSQCSGGLLLFPKKTPEKNKIKKNNKKEKKKGNLEIVVIWRPG